MSVTEIQAIDVHGHYGVHTGAPNDLIVRFMTGDGATVVERAAQARTKLTVVSPLLGLMPRGKADAEVGNEEAFEVVGKTEGLLQWVLVNPLQPGTYAQAERMLESPKCAGIKIHPEEHCYPITEHGEEIFEFAARHHAVVTTHSGEPNSLPADFVELANTFPEVTLILGHLGFGHDGDMSHQVRAIQASRHGNLYADTSSMKSITPNLVEWAVDEVGADRLLYGTDTPLYFAPMQRARIDYAGISDEEKRLVLVGNATRILGLP